jgi:hypothetical protein
VNVDSVVISIPNIISIDYIGRKETEKGQKNIYPTAEPARKREATPSHLAHHGFSTRFGVIFKRDVRTIHWNNGTYSER